MMHNTPKATPPNVVEMLVHCANRNEMGANFQQAEKCLDGLFLTGEAG